MPVQAMKGDGVFKSTPGSPRPLMAARALSCLTNRDEAWWSSRLLGFGRSRRSGYVVRYDDERGAVELAVSAGIVPKSWSDPESAPRWRCERCSGLGLSRAAVATSVSACPACSGLGHVTAPPCDGSGVGTLASLVAFAATERAAALIEAADEVAPRAGLPPVTLRACYAERLSAEHAAKCHSTDGGPACMFAEAFVAGSWDAAPAGGDGRDIEWALSVAARGCGAHVTAFSASLFELSFEVPFGADFLGEAET